MSHADLYVSSESEIVYLVRRSVNPISTRGGTLSPPSTARPPDFQTLRHAYCLVLIYLLCAI